MKLRISCAVVALTVLSIAAAAPVAADTIVADVELDYYNSGANSSFSTGYYGGTSTSFPVSLTSSSNARDGVGSTFISLPTGSYITLGFSGGYVFDGTGDDLFVSEFGAASETADVYVSSDLGTTFTFLGTANGNTVSMFDLSDISFTGNVNAVKIVGLDSFGGSPGFDLAFVKGLEGSVAVVPEPGSIALLGMGVVGLAVARRRRGRSA